MSFTHLQVRSGYSLLHSTITIDKLIEHTKHKQFDAIALTDEHVLHGVVPFYRACVNEGIQPIIGMIVHTKDDSEREASIVLLAKSNAGYRQLRLLSTYIQENEFDSISIDDLATYQTDLIGILPAKNNPLEELLLSDTYQQVDAYIEPWRQLFDEGDFYIGIGDHGEAAERNMQTSLKTYQATYQTPVVAVSDVRYLEPEDEIAYDVLCAMKKGTHWRKQQSSAYRGKQQHLRTRTEMEDVFSSFWPEILHETENIRHKCDVSLVLDQQFLPSYPVPEAMSAHRYLEKICWNNIVHRYANVTEEVASRLRYELDVINSMGYSDYFLIVWDFIAHAKQQNILVGPGRGSSASSIVAYVLGITDVDPIENELLFERFLNPERITMPDIDVDFSDHRRDEVIEYVQARYGREHVAQIITFGTYQPRSLVRELSKTMGVDAQDVQYILRHIPHGEQSIAQLARASDELKTYIKHSNTLKTLFFVAHKLEGLPRNVSTHAAGVVICDDPLVEHVPLATGSSDVPITQYPMDDLEAIGLLKMDFLGLRNLTLLEHIQTSIRKEEGTVITLEDIPYDDRTTFALLQRGKTNGVFQLESTGMKNVLTRLKPNHFDDIVAVNALFRPGPMDYIPVYIDRKNQVDPTVYPHPDLEPILKNTYGVLVYQEQIMLIAHEIAGFSLGQADILRRAVSKKKHEMMDEQKQYFLTGCMKNGYSQQVAEEIFAWIVKFSNYGFPRSHAVAYSKIAYQLAYFKAHYPASFYSELLSSLWNQQQKVRSYMQEIKSLHIEVYPPSINASYGKYTVEKGAIRMGLLSIKGIGHHAVRTLVDERKNGRFKSLFDFCLRLSSNVLNRKTMELLIVGGAFDPLHSNRASLLASLDQAMEQGELFKEFNNQPDLFEDKITLEASYTEIEDFSSMKRLADEKELFGFYISSHPLADYRKLLRQNEYRSLNEAIQIRGKRNIQSAAVIQAMKTIRTKRGDPMAFVTLSDETSEMEGVIFPDLYRKVNRFLEEESMVVFTGNIEVRNDSLQWLLSEIQPFTEQMLTKRQSNENSRLFIRYPKEEHQKHMETIRAITALHPGSTPIIVYHEEVKETYQLHSSYNVSPSADSVQAFKEKFGDKNVVLTKS